MQGNRRRHNERRDRKGNRGASRSASRSATTREKGEQARRKRHGLPTLAAESVWGH